MVADYWDMAGASKDFLRQFLPLADKEMDWWDDKRSVNVTLEGELSNETKKRPSRSQHTYTLYQYKAETNCPRPENFLEDYENGMQSGHDPQFTWSSTASACESGLDFSTRWFSSQGDLAYSRKSIKTNQLVPVDLNVFMVQNFDALARLYGDELGEREKAEHYRERGRQLRQAIDAVFKDKEHGSKSEGLWFDYDLESGQLRKRFYPSNVYPLLVINATTSAEERDTACLRVISYLNASGILNYKGGVPSSLEEQSKEQWDFPNGWAPIQHLVVESLEQCPQPEAHTMARTIADAFITTSYNGLFQPLKGYPAQMWEKYDVRYDDGRSGFGGEYPVQAGFGWTNGVVLDFIRRYYTVKSRAERTGESDGMV